MDRHVRQVPRQNHHHHNHHHPVASLFESRPLQWDDPGVTVALAVDQWRSMAQSPPRGGGGSDGCARGSNTSGRPSQWPWQKRCTTQLQGDRRLPGPEVRPGVLEDPEPRRETEHELYAAPRGPKPPSPGVPSLAAPLLAGQATEVLDASTLSPSSHGLSWRRRTPRWRRRSGLRRQEAAGGGARGAHAGAQQAGPRRLAAHSSRERGLEGAGLSPSFLCREEEERVPAVSPQTLGI